MSYKNSNIYASRVFAEHPLALWAIDENLFFKSLIPENAKTINNYSWWTITNGQFLDIFDPPSQIPIEDAYISKIYLPLTGSGYTMEIVSDEIDYELNFDQEKNTVCFNFFIYIPNSTVVNSIECGITVGTEENKVVRQIQPSDYGFWKKVEIIQQVTDYRSIYPFIRINFDDSVTKGEEGSSIFISGISVGQWSEAYNSNDTGIISTDIPSEIKNLISEEYSSVIKGVLLDPYGFNDSDTGYVIEYRNKLLAETSGLPIVYGSKNNVSIISSSIGNDYFSSIIDGGTNLDYSEALFSSTIDSGDYDDPITEIYDGGSSSSTYTSEISGGFPFSISGVESIDGIDFGSASSSFTSLINGGTSFTTSQFINVPSLVFPGKGFLNKSGIYSNITVEFWTRINNESPNQVKIFGPISSEDGIYVGGEFITVKVGKYVKSYFIGQWYRPMLIHFGQSINEIFLMINGEKVISIQIESLKSIDSITDEDEDYIGFYGNSLVFPFDIDCFSIFPYVVSEQVAKIRFVYGQGVTEQESIIESFGGNLTYIDFPYAGYSSTISYPDRTQWSSGYFNNLNVDSLGLSLPKYTLPEVLFRNIYNENSAGEYELIWSNFYKDNFDIQNETYPYISMIPKYDYSFFNSSIYFSSIDKTNYPTKSIYGLMKAGSDVSTEQSLLFLSNNNDINTFEIKIQSGSIKYLYNSELLESQQISASSAFSVGIDIDKISSSYPQTSAFFSNTKILSLNLGGNSQNTFKGKIYSLTLNNKFYTDKDNLIGLSGIADKVFDESMYDYVGAYTLVPKLSNSEMYFDIACRGYWESSLPMSYFGKYVTMANGSKIYDLDLIQFNIDIPTTSYSRSTEDSENYNNSVKNKAYITVQPVSTVGMKPYTDYVNTEIIGNNRILDLNSDFDISDTKFEVCDSTVIFPIKEGSNFADFYITVHIDMVSSGINTENIKIKRMSLSSLSFDESRFYSINTPTGRSIYPVSKANGQYVYKKKNPVNIDIESGNYFYVKGNSGIQIISNTETNVTNSLSFPINQTLESDLNIVGLQMYLMFNEAESFTYTKTIAKLFNKTKEYDIIMIPEYGGKRARVSIVDSITKTPISGITYFLNGKLVSNLIVKPLEWNALVFSFESNAISLDQEIGQLEVYPGVRVDNVAVFSDINQIKSTLVLTDSWDDVNDNLWEYYGSGSAGTSATWLSVLNTENIPLVILSINGTDIFNTYSGISSAVGNDSNLLNVNFDSINIINDADWYNFDIKPI